jgi:AcrR family transcriptional regulator
VPRSASPASTGPSGGAGSGASGDVERRKVGRAGTPAQGRELRARGKRTMRKLLDAGIEVFSKKGYHAARVDDIVKVAKTSHGTFYLYFANKEDLFQALVLDVADELGALSESIAPIVPGAEGRQSLRDWLEKFSAIYEHYGPVIRTWTEAEVDDTEAGRIGADTLGLIADSLTKRVSAAALPGIDPQIASLAFVAMIERFHYFSVSGQIDADRAAMLDTLAAITHAGFFGGDP